MAEIFVCPKDSISDRSVRALREAGVIVVQADNPETCRFIRAGEEVSSRDMLWAALKALEHKPQSADYGSDARLVFIRALFGSVDEARKARLEPPASPAAVDPVGGISTPGPRA